MKTRFYREREKFTRCACKNITSIPVANTWRKLIFSQINGTQEEKYKDLKISREHNLKLRNIRNFYSFLYIYCFHSLWFINDN